jgi:hypothetical protein
LWGQSSGTTSSCPACGTCERCNVNSGKCGYRCENCAAAALCSQAQKFPSYVTLQNFLAQQSFTASEPQALELINTDDTISSVLGTNYVGNSPNQTATLTFTVATTGLNAYAVEFSNGSPQFGYFVSADGNIQQILPPYQLTTTTAGADASTGVTQTAETSALAAAAPRSTGSGACETYCNLMCSEEGSSECVALADARCIATIEFGPEAPLMCVLLAKALCDVGSSSVCLNLCTASKCQNPAWEPCGSNAVGLTPPTCGTCQTCNKGLGICTPTICKPGFSCDSTIGTCVCNNLCGDTCCNNGHCVNNTCITTCPSGYTQCGTNCCASGTFCCGTTSLCCSAATTCCGGTCCQQGSACINGSCTASPCGANTLCQGSSILCCNPATEICCKSGISQACIPAGNTCCITPEGIIAGSGCFPGQVCCNAGGPNIGPVCCGPNAGCGPTPLSCA